MSIPFNSRLLFKYKNLITTLKDDNGRATNHENASEDPNLDEYHSIKRREEDKAHKPKNPQNRTHSQTNHVDNPTATDRSCPTARRFKYNQ